MSSTTRPFWQALVPVWFFLASVLAQAGCSCGPTEQVLVRQFLACQSRHANVPVASPLQSKIIAPGTIRTAFALTDSGDATLSMPLSVPPGRAGVEPSLGISYSSSAGDGVLGVGFSLNGPSAITRCPKTMAVDNEIRAVHYDAEDALCIDGKRLVLIAQNGATAEYRTLPDTQIKLIGDLTNQMQNERTRNEA